MTYRTVDGTATSGSGDYIDKTGALTFAPGETTKTITIEVKGDSKKEADEKFYLDLFGNNSNALSGTCTSAKSRSRSMQPSSSKWISGPASQMTGGAGSVSTTQPPLDILANIPPASPLVASP